MVLQTGMVTMPETYYVKVMRGSPKHQSQFKSLKGKAADGVYVNLWLTRTVEKEIQSSSLAVLLWRLLTDSVQAVFTAIKS